MNRYSFLIPCEDSSFYIRFQNTKCISIYTSFCVIHAYKFNSHSYSLKIFMYFSKRIYCYDGLSSKIQLITYIRNYISEEEKYIKMLYA